ncbi:hypothetical protein LTR56_006694 [Elasticomyces elasticus]|nr:hypothetical protein LTR22_017705 [Elasticomyces elasticus]KAK3649795.1 hypothetical protein LTR56_006694 [Elasticomyces elasticus]KAK4913063.1 hypothetical protein LTR49_018529 [Elasticomyces elasticus]KAK5762487.1 hypothetical protein LTS12_007278 [Elasticomyces elasticus]
MAAFGFSVGDFFSAATLILQATKALRESDAARAECQQAAAFLEGVERTLRKVVSVMSPDGDPDAYQDIIPYAEACRNQVIRSLDRFKKYEDRLTDVSEGPRLGWQKVEKMLVKNRMKLKWVFASKDDLAQIRAAITPQLELLQLSMQFVEMRRTATIAEAQGNLLTMTRSIHTRLDLFMPILSPDTVAGAEKSALASRHGGNDQHVRALRKKYGKDTLTTPRRFSPTGPCTTDVTVTSDQVLAMFMLYLWQSLSRLLVAVSRLPSAPSFLLDTNITLRDALGRSMSLPYEHFRYWPVMMARLEVAFGECPGYSKVQQSSFAMFTVRSKGSNAELQHFDMSNWDSTVRPGTNLIMSMEIEGQGNRLDECPRCRTISTDAAQLGWSAWLLHRVDHGVLRRYTAEEQAAAAAELLDMGFTELEMTMSVSDVLAQIEEADLDIGAFKRVHWKTIPCKHCSAIFTSVEQLTDHLDTIDEAPQTIVQ